MAATEVGLYSLNSGEVSRLATARVDLAKLRVACEIQSNWLPHVLGPTMVRPGTAYKAGVLGDQAGWLGEFYHSEASTTLLVATPNNLQFWLGEAYLTRPAVTAAVANGTFDTNLTSWTDNDEAGATSAWATGGYMSLIGTEATYAFQDQQVTVNEANVEHALRVVITRGTVLLKVGTAVGLAEYFDVKLAPGTYSLAFTPTGNFWIRLGGNTYYPSLVDSVTIEAAGVVSLPIPWASTTDFDRIRYDQSGDVIFVASGYQQRRIERRTANSRSWGVALYLADDGPFRLSNLSADTTLGPLATRGTITLTASRPFFKSGHAGALFKLTHSGQTATAVLAAADVFTAAIRISGVGNTRPFAVIISGTFTATVTLQRSIGAVGSWVDVAGESYTGPVSKMVNDTLDNQIIFYRLGIKTGNYTSGSADCALIYVGSSQTGICRLTSVTNTTTAIADVLQEFGATGSVSDWAEGEWSDYRGWPSAVAFDSGRLFWEPSIKLQGSVSDAFHSFDDTVVGDSGPINRTITTGGVDGGRWILSLLRLLVGTAGQVVSVRASAFDEPLTPTALVARACSTQGVASRVRAVKIDGTGVFVARNGKQVFELIFDAGGSDYKSRELTRLKQEMCAAGVRDVAVQRQPDTRVWFVLGDGSCAVLTYDRDDEVIAWTPVVGGTFERVAVLPGTDEDDVYFIVARTIGGATKRYIEKLAKRTECVGGVISKTMDSHVVYSGGPTTVISAPHLAGQQVALWADGAPVVGPITLNGSGIGAALAAFSNACYGLAYTARLKTVKLAYGAEHGTALEMQKRVARVGLDMADVAPKGVRIGRDFDHMTGLPATYKGKPLTAGQVLTAFDANPGSFNGGWDSDARVCIEVQSPYPCTLKALVLQMTTNEMDDVGPKKG